MMLHESFTSIQRDADGRVVEFKLDRVGRAMLGVSCWRLIAALMAPMLPAEITWWAKFLRRNPKGAIEAYAEARRSRGEDVDVGAALEALKSAKPMGEGPWN